MESEKFRIRYYNDNLSNIVLERKMKVNSLCKKRMRRLVKRNAENC